MRAAAAAPPARNPLAAAAASGGAARRVAAAFSAYLAARQAFADAALDLLGRDDGRATLEAMLQRDAAALLCCPLIQDASPGGCARRWEGRGMGLPAAAVAARM
jgi:hypothetical protein